MKRKLVAGAVAGLAVAGGGAAAVAATQTGSPQEESKAVVEDAAKQLGVQPSELSNALKQALKNRIDAAVAAGRLTEEQGKELKERIDTEAFPLLGPGLRGDHHGPGGLFHHGLDAAAEYLGTTEEALREQLRNGTTLAEAAKKAGKSGGRPRRRARRRREGEARRGAGRRPDHRGREAGEAAVAPRARDGARERRAARGRVCGAVRSRHGTPRPLVVAHERDRELAHRAGAAPRAWAKRVLRWRRRGVRGGRGARTGRPPGNGGPTTQSDADQSASSTGEEDEGWQWGGSSIAPSTWNAPQAQSHAS